MSLLATNSTPDDALAISTNLETRSSTPVAQPGFHFGGGGQSSGGGPPGITGPRFSLSAASVGPRYLLHVHERGVIRPPGVWLLIEPEATLYM